MVVVALAGCASAREDKPQAAARPAKEVVTGSARVRGGGLRMDVQIGAFGKRPARGGTVVVTPTAVVTP